MYKINGNDIDVYVVIRGYYGNDIILKNITKDEVKCVGQYKNCHRAVNECKKIKRIIEFICGEVSNARTNK